MRIFKWLLCSVIALSTVGANACEAIGADGKPVYVASEQAVIVWDAERKLEHFVRIANFQTDAKNLGFLVPTPSVPDFETAKEDLFDVVGVAAAKRITSIGCKKDDPVAAGAAVKLAHIGGYAETVLSLSNPLVVAQWLREHSFPFTDATRAWLAPYMKKRWVITAFQMDSQNGTAKLEPIRMTFHADQPFYPYREPKQNGDPGDDRTLGVFFLSSNPVTATIAGHAWVGRQEVSDALNSDEVQAIAANLPGVELPQGLWLTSFLDSSSPRIGTDDVLFQRERRLPTAWIAPTAVVGIVVAVVYRVRRRRSLQRAGII